MNAYIDKINPFSDAFFKKQLAQKKRWSLLAVITRPLWRFFRAYILRCGFLDGFPGLWIAVATAFSVFVRYSRSYETPYSQGETWCASQANQMTEKRWNACSLFASQKEES